MSLLIEVIIARIEADPIPIYLYFFLFLSILTRIFLMPYVYKKNQFRRKQTNDLKTIHP